MNAAMFAYRVAITPDAMQGRVQSATGMLAMGLNPAGPLLGGALVELWGGHWAFAGFAGILAVTAIVASLSQGIRRMRPLEANAGQSPPPEPSEQ
ncbi:hypothetical protein [Actinopolymorpha alba]|uniref:hypothetical protein n=1 Tax=Actinopolymorpha alba TaxID=533267 RepID=UPI0003770851|nr:hypothetical protein [Actinopolymorpha alba]